MKWYEYEIMFSIREPVFLNDVHLFEPVNFFSAESSVGFASGSLNLIKSNICNFRNNNLAN